MAEIKTYIGGVYEEEILLQTPKDCADSSLKDLCRFPQKALNALRTLPTIIKQKHYIKAGGELVAIHTKDSTGSEDTKYVHNDHLGSIQTITDAAGTLVKVLSFDSWGKRRNAETWAPEDNVAVNETDRGFTGHEHLDEVNLIHMNGRVYDPVIGRFLSADPFVQMPDFTQSLNRYSYVLNNPLSLVDPSGYLSLKDVFKIGVTIGVGILTGGAALSLLPGVSLSVGISAVASGGVMATGGVSGVIIAGVGMGFGASFSGTLLAGGSLDDALRSGLKGGIVGGISAGIFLGIDKLLPKQLYTTAEARRLAGKSSLSLVSRAKIQLTRMSARGITKGVISELNGGNFQSGFKMSLIGDSVDSILSGFKETRYRAEQKKLGFDTSLSALEDIESTWIPGKGGSYKLAGESVSCGGCNNLGVANSDHWLVGEHGIVMKFLGGNIPGLNSGSVFHDYLAGALQTDSRVLNLITNQGTILPAIALDYVSLGLGRYNFSTNINDKRP
jgi:RHS repeat-associated protein